MGTGASVLLLLLLAASLPPQVLVDTLRFPLKASYQLQVPAENEIFALPFDHDTFSHSIDGGVTWTIAAIPRSWQRRPPVYALPALVRGAPFRVPKTSIRGNPPNPLSSVCFLHRFPLKRIS